MKNSLPDWYIIKNFTQNERYAIETVEPKFEKETEKAKLVSWNTEFGTIKKWIPKSIINNTYKNNKKIICYAIYNNEKVGIIEKGNTISQIENGKWIVNTSLKFI